MKKIGITRVAVTILVIIVSLFAAATVRSEIYINNFPADIVINEGEPMDVPIFFDCKLYANKPVEFYIFKEDLTTQAKAYLSQAGWVSFTDDAEVRIFASLDSMVEYANIVFRAFDDTTGMNSILLSVCIDPSMSGQLTEGADCSQRAVLINEVQNECLGLSLSEATVTKTVAGGQKASVQIGVKDMCNQDIAFDAASEENWISLTKQTEGLTATLDSSGLSPGTYKGSIQVISGGASKKIDVSLTVSTQVCSGVTVSPTAISKTLTRGQSETVQISVKDSCGNNMAVTSFDATSEQNWISLIKQTGGLAATLNSSTLLPGTHSGVVKVSSGGASAQVSVSLTVKAPSISIGGGGSCTPSSLSVWPVSLTVNSGETKSQSASITNNCGTAASYTASVASGNSWLTAQSSGSGTMSVTGKAAGMSAGTYQGSVSVSSGGLGTATLNVTMIVQDTGPCEPSTANVSPSSISKSSSVGTSVSGETLTIKDNCGNNIPYTITAVTGSWISSPYVQYAGTGSLTVSFNTAALAAGSYDGSIALNLGSFGTKNVPVRVTLSNVDSSAAELYNAKIIYNSYSPGQVRYFRFMETSSRGAGNINPTRVEMMDMTQSTGMYNIEMLVKYAGPNCEDGKPTVQDYTDTKAGLIKPGQDGLYFSYAGSAFESVGISNNPEGCYYVMVQNVSDTTESRISTKYYDFDSYTYSELGQ